MTPPEPGSRKLAGAAVSPGAGPEEYAGVAVFFFYPRKNQLFPRIFSISYPRKIESTREKIFKTAREKKIVPVKNLAKLHPRKKILHPRKKYKIPPEKIPKVPEKKSLKSMGKKTKQQYS